jgi:hypothetical protein
LIGGLLQVSLAAFAAGALFVLGVVLLRKLFAGRRA